MDAEQDSYSASTRRNYAGAWRQFARWSEREGFDALPAKPETVAAYLAERANDGLSPASLRMDRAAIRYRHSEAGHANPADNEGVRRVLRGLTRRAAWEGRAPKQAAALTAKALEAIRSTAHLRRTGPGGRTEGTRTARRRGRVDVALISVMRDAMLRRSEAAALTWADVEFRSDGSARVNVRRSKSDQDGNGATLYVGRAAATALQAIYSPDASLESPVFGLRSGRAVSNRIAKAARAAGLVGRFSGHSPRIGMARDLVADGAGVAAVQVAGRWASPQMPSYYARAELAGDGAVARFYGEE
ncbi:MAG: tyrosine-type recombinase/integrase [Gemmatimonadota bacterium]|nr:tyrosine-type recombinase/integrase [Gemmatimonadota bacterium]